MNVLPQNVQGLLREPAVPQMSTYAVLKILLLGLAGAYVLSRVVRSLHGK